MLHENKSVGQLRGENEIYELFTYFDPLSSYIDIWIFIAKYSQMTPQSTRNRTEIIFVILTVNYNEIKLRNIWVIIYAFSKNTQNQVKTAKFSLSLLCFLF